MIKENTEHLKLSIPQLSREKKMSGSLSIIIDIVCLCIYNKYNVNKDFSPE
jgi:hypothetical protein